VTEEAPKPLDVALDVLVYAPVGLALTAAEELPKLADKGRARVNAQINMARVVGRFAVTQGRQSLERRLAGTLPSSDRPAAVVDPEPAGSAGADDVVANGSSSGPGSVGGPAPEWGAPTGAAVTARPSPSPGRLAIPGYDSLSAPQVVQRLAGLNREELDAVRAYEDAQRGRRTILNRIDQLQGQ
jgi:hypothetical protein